MKNPKIVLLVNLILLNFTLAIGQENNSNTSIFPKGNQGPESNFTGRAWAQGLIENDSIYNTVVASVTFEAGARTKWHSHPSGQLMLVIDGNGYHQIKGQPRELIRKGDVAKCPPNTIHWHGATEDSSMTHIVVLPNTERGIVEWMHAVSN